MALKANQDVAFGLESNQRASSKHQLENQTQLTNLIKSKTSIFEKSRSDKEFNPYFQMAKTQECF